MSCDHIGPQDVIEMTEEHLRKVGIPADEWRGTRALYGENQPSGSMWESVLIGIERRDDHWVVTRLDRNREPLPERETGLRVTRG